MEKKIRNAIEDARRGGLPMGVLTVSNEELLDALRFYEQCPDGVFDQLICVPLIIKELKRRLNEG